LAIVSSGTRNARDVLCAQPTERPQRQRDLGVEPERRVAAGEDELEPLVGDDRFVHLVLHRLRDSEQLRLRRQRAIAADAVDGAVARRCDEPGARVRGRAVARPALGGDRERLLGGFLGEIEVAEEADQAGEDAAPLVAEDLVEDRYPALSGRTSTAPPRRAAGMRAASAMAASRSSAS
jgi:hypothetical protein